MASPTWCVLVEDQLHDLYDTLRQTFEIIFFQEFLQNLDQYGPKINAIVGGSGISLVILHIDKMPNLEVLFYNAVGTDKLNLPFLWQKGIRVANLGHKNAIVTAELGFALMIASARNLKLAMTAYQDKIAIKTFRNKHCGMQLCGSTIGIVGMGAIGYTVAERAAAFKMNILYHNRNRVSEVDEARVRATYCDTLEKLLVQSDFIMLCLPLNNETTNLIGAAQLKMMKSTAILINISRGGIVDQNALITALRENVIGGAAMDVTTPEPLPQDHPLLHMENVIVTPHYGGDTKEFRKDLRQIVFDNLIAGLEGKPMPQELKP